MPVSRPELAWVSAPIRGLLSKLSATNALRLNASTPSSSTRGGDPSRTSASLLGVAAESG